jgi:hypothetical protein
MDEDNKTLLIIAVVMCIIGVVGYFVQTSGDKVKIACYESAKVNTNIKCETKQ